MSMKKQPQPELPYGDTSGWAGSEASRERAERANHSGATAGRWHTTITLLEAAGVTGLTYHELGQRTNWHHGQSSGALSQLHKAGRIVRLKERRDRCSVYVLPQYTGGRDTAAPGTTSTTQMLAEMYRLLNRADRLWHPRPVDWHQAASDVMARYEATHGVPDE